MSRAFSHSIPVDDEVVAVPRPRRVRRWRASLVAGAMAGALVAGCGSSTGQEGEGGDGRSPGDARTPVTLVLDWSPNTNHAGIYLADAKGWYDEAGIDLKIIEPGANGGLQAVATGSAEFAISVQEELTPARASGVPVVSVAAIIEHNTSSLLSLASDGIERPVDLVGKRYGGWGGQLEHAIIDALVSCDGGDPATVQYVSVGDADYRVGLETDRYDSVWVFDGWDGIRFAQAGVETTRIEFADYVDCIPDWYTPLIATSDELISTEPELIGRFITATARGYRAAIANPDEAADALLVAAPELDADLVRESSAFLAERYATDPARWGYQEPTVWSVFTEFLDGAGMLSGPVEVDAAYTNRFLGLDKQPDPTVG